MGKVNYTIVCQSGASYAMSGTLHALSGEVRDEMSTQDNSDRFVSLEQGFTADLLTGGCP